MEANTVDDVTCKVFGTLDERDPDFDRNRIHRFVVGEDDAPRAMEQVEAEAEFADPFATLLLLQGKFPRSAAECLGAIDDATADDDPLRQQMTFLIGEASQISAEEAPNIGRSMRFVITRGGTANGPPEGPDILLSVSRPEQKEIELMAWDRRIGGFNYYRAVGSGPSWVFAGNARHALVDPTRGKGPFESHKSGALVMKELKLPWVHWDSPVAQILQTAFAAGDPMREHEWFTQKEPGGAYTLELAVAKPAIARWAKARFDQIVAKGGTVDRPDVIVEHIVGTPTANLASSQRESRNAIAAQNPIDLPQTFFVDADAFGFLGLQAPPAFSVASSLYAAAIETFDVKLSDGQGFDMEGDSHFAFVVPERAFEDLVVLQEAVRIGLITRRLAAALLMTDFPNPLFSDRRASLMAAAGTISGNASTFSQEMADAILAAAENSPLESAEREFAERWNVGEQFEQPFAELLAPYYAAISQRLTTQEGFNDFFRLAESRRKRTRENSQQPRKHPIFGEFALLYPSTNLDEPPLSMRADATVVRG